MVWSGLEDVDCFEQHSGPNSGDEKETKVDKVCDDAADVLFLSACEEQKEMKEAAAAAVVRVLKGWP